MELGTGLRTIGLGHDWARFGVINQYCLRYPIYSRVSKGVCFPPGLIQNVVT